MRILHAERMMIAAAMLLAGWMHSAPLTAQTGERAYPRSGGEMRKAIAAGHGAGDRAAVTGAALDLAEMGGTLSPPSLDLIRPNLDAALIAARWPGAVGEERVAALLNRLRDNGAPFAVPGAGGAFAEVPADHRLVEGVAWDARTGRLFAGTVIAGRLAYRDHDGSWKNVPLGSPRGSLFGIATDARRRLLWIATGSLEQTAVEGERMAGLIAVDLDRLSVVRRVPIAAGEAGAVGDLTVAADGTVYASNVLSGAIHRCRLGCTTMETMLPAGTFRNPQGLAISRDGRLLYVADYISGLWVIELASGARTQIGISQPMMLEGIDGLIGLGDGSLIAIQNGSRPRRIVRLRLDPAGRAITRMDVQIVFAPEVGESTLGTLQESNSLLFVADSQWERYGPGGAPTENAGPDRATPIRRLTLSR